MTGVQLRPSVRDGVQLRHDRFSEAVIHDPKLDIGKTVGVKSVPTQVLVDGKGVVRYVRSGPKPDSLDVFEQQIKALLGTTGGK